MELLLAHFQVHWAQALCIGSTNYGNTVFCDTATQLCRTVEVESRLLMFMVSQSTTSHCADQHMEHMNQVVKMTVEGLGANTTEKAIVRTGKSVELFSDILATFDDEA